VVERFQVRLDPAYPSLPGHKQIAAVVFEWKTRVSITMDKPVNKF
jgi:hypothetical protein